MVTINWILLLPFLKQIRKIIAAAPLQPDHANQLEKAACLHLIERFCNFSNKIFIYELNIFSREQTFENPQVAYKEFIIQTKTEDFLLNRIKKYTSLNRRLTSLANHFIYFLSEHIVHWNEDKKAIAHQFNLLLNQSKLLKITFGNGDPHYGAKTGAIYRFQDFSLFYKPRNLETDTFYNTVLEMIAPSCGKVPTLNCKTHGWQLGIGGTVPSDHASATHFFRQAGMHLATSHFLAASDIHYENLISDHTGAVYLVDTEALFTNAEFLDKPDPATVGRLNRSSAEVAVEKWFRNSIFRTGIVSNSSKKMGQFSGLSTSSAVMAPVKTFTVINPESGDMTLKQTETQINIVTSLPKINDRIVEPSEFREVLLEGYDSVIQLTKFHHSDLITLINQQAPSLTRQVLRDTYLYSLFITESTHPIIASDETQLTNFLNKMDRAFVFSPHLAAIKSSERTQMDLMDTPIFQASPYADHLAGSTGRMYETTAKDQAVTIINDVCCDHGARTKRLIRDLYPVPGEPTSLPSDLGGAIHHVFDVIARNTFLGADGKSVAWVGRISPNQEEEQIVGPLEQNIYDGPAGILRFVSTYAKYSNKQTAFDLAHLIISTLEHALQFRDDERPPGLHSGELGIILALSDAAITLALPELQTRVAIWVKKNAALLNLQHSTDIIEGEAGSILVYLALYERTQDPFMLELAVKAGDRLLAVADTTAGRCLWVFPKVGRVILGFSHGVAGIAYSLFCLASVSGLPRFLDIAKQAIASEDTFYSNEMMNWPDLRTGETHFSHGWCNGSAGTILTRLKMWPHLTEDQHTRVRNALSQLRRISRCSDDSLCHGTCGVIECLWIADAVLGDGCDEASFLLNTLLTSKRYHSGYSFDPQNLGLMVGLSGIGLTALRAAGHDILPSPLLTWEVNQSGA